VAHAILLSRMVLIRASKAVLSWGVNIMESRRPLII
jgi:hypothetical protein